MANLLAVQPSDGVRFGLLGPLQAVDAAGTAQVVSAAKQRVVLAALLLTSDRVVPAASLADALWDVSPPTNALSVVRTYVSRLRRSLGPVGERIVGHPAGWAVELAGPGEFDLAEVDWLWRTARGEADAEQWQRVSSLLGRALSLWRGEPLVDVPSDALARREVGRLAELRLQLTEARVDADLRLGRHAELVAELRRLAVEHPLREHFRVQLMLAYYRCGQQAAALEIYRGARATLAEDLGVEPGPELVEMHQKILTADPALTAGVPAEVVRRSNGHDPRRLDNQEPVPRQLPAPVAQFTGRERELAALTALLDGADEAAGAVVISAIGGMAGVGKTALAVHWAHRVADRFPDGQLYVNLRGFDPSGKSVPPTAALRSLLDGLGVAAELVPAGLEAQAGLYRSLLAGKRTLVVLDNARDEHQIRPLLPGGPGCLVVVTSRRRLEGLIAAEGAWLLELEVLDRPTAGRLLAARLGQRRLDAEPAAVTELIGVCAGLPLALAIAAARVSARPHLPLSALAGELQDARDRLDVLDTGDGLASVRAIFSWSLSSLPRPAADMFALLGVHPGPDITIPAAASLAGASPAETRRALRQLAEAHLATEHIAGRFTLHDLVRAYAAEQASNLPEAERRAATHRMLDHYLHTAAVADHLLRPDRRRTDLPPCSPGATPEDLAGRDQALAWLDAEHRGLVAVAVLAADDGFDVHAWQLAFSLETFFYRRGHWQDWEFTQRTALSAASRLGDERAQAHAHSGIGDALIEAGQPARAASHLDRALQLCEEAGDVFGQARLHLSAGRALGTQGLYRKALARHRLGLRLARSAGPQARYLQADARNFVGFQLAMLGRYSEAVRYCKQAVMLMQQLDHRHGLAGALDSLAYVYRCTGHHVEAARCYQQAAELFRELGDRHQSAVTLGRIGDAHHDDGNHAAAHQAWTQALAILDDLHHPDAIEIRAKLRQETIR
jgi:DNA-binding SARP family transcriptional activator/tetratricopeptide (TPR) repeat protein